MSFFWKLLSSPILRLLIIPVAVLVGSGLPSAADTPPLMMTPGNFGVSAMGASTYTIPIIVPPGTGGMAPALSIDYSSQNADGTLGLGWVLGGLASITRCPRTIAQENVHGGVNFDNNDRYCMEGQRLVLISGTYGANGSQYRTEIDSFAEIIAHGSAGNGPQWFEVHTKAGQILQFGNSTSSLVLTVNAATGVVGPTARTWLVNKISDTRGNYLTVTYTNDTTNGQAYPTEIDYTGNANASPVLSPYNSVKFSYETRPDIVPTYQAGALMQLTVLLTDIKTYAGSLMVFDYKFGYKLAASGSYHDELQTVTQYDSAGHNLPPVTIGWQGGVGLPSMTTINYTGVGPSGAPGPGIFPGDFNGDGITDVLGASFSGCAGQGIWIGTGGGNFTPSTITDSYYVYGSGTITNSPACFGSTSISIYGVTDIDGDGFSDVLTDWTIYSENQLFAYRNNQSGNLAQTPMSISPAIFFNSGIPVVLSDFNGDGMLDYFQIGAGSASGQVFYGNGNGTFTAGSTWPQINTNNTDALYTTPTPAEFGVQATDFDGDGCSDIVTQGTVSALWYMCNPATTSATIPDWRDMSATPSLFQMVFGDFNGDGKTDILEVVNNGLGTSPACGESRLYLSTGTGLVQSSFSVPSDWCKYEIVAGDFSGDGKTDIALIPPGDTGLYGPGTPVSIWLSTGSGFVQVSTIPNTETTWGTYWPATGFEEYGSAADWGSDGAADLWMGGPSSNPLYHFNYVPELVTSVSNGVGSTTTIQYNPLNTNGTLYTKGTTETYPTQDVDGPIYVVSAVTRSNGIGGTQTTTYSYAGAQKDLSGRGFLGFTQITQSTPAEPYITSSVPSAAIVQTTNYGLPGANGLDFPFTGMVVSQTKVAQWPTGSVTLSSTTNAFREDFLPVGLDGVKRYFLTMSSSTTQSNDLNVAAYPSVTTTHTFDCDSNPTNTCYGDETQTVLTRSDGSSATTNNTYTEDATDWLLGRVTSSSVDSIVGSSNITRTKSSCYDTAGSTCRDPAAPTPSGLLMQETVEPGVSDVTQISTTNYSYDVYGNKLSVAVTACVWSSGTCTNTTRTTTMTYTPTTAQFLLTDTNAYGESESWVYNASFGVPSSHKGPNGLTTSWTQDTFGRQTKEARPDTTETVTSYLYCTGTNGGSASCPTYGAYLTQSEAFESNGTTQIGPIGIAYRDGLSRPIASDTQGFDGGGSPPWIRVSTQYNTFGHVSQTSRPYFVTGGTPAWTVNTTIDALGRPILINDPDGGSVSFVYNALQVTKTEHNPVAGSPSTETTITLKNAESLVQTMTDAKSGTTNYVYDAFGDVLTTTDPTGSNVITATYDTIGRKLTSHDPDLGAWSYVYDGFGELYTQTDAKSQVTTMSYDMLGRLVSRAEADMTSTWTFGIGGTSGANNQATYPDSIDKLVVAACTSPTGVTTCITNSSGVGYSRTYFYDALSRQKELTVTNGTSNYSTTTTYNTSTGRITTVRDFSGFKTTNLYTNLGYLSEITDTSTAFVYWQANARDAELHLIQQTMGTAIFESQGYDPNSGRVLAICATTDSGSCDGNTANYSYSWDIYANLVQRADTLDNVTENFCYDALNRLTNYGINGTSCTTGNTNSVKTVSYDSLGDILTKSDVGTYTYPTAGSALPHAVSGISTTTGCTLVAPEAPCTVGGTVSPTYTYDANGNMLTGAGRTVTYTAANMTHTVNQGADTYRFNYDTEHNRFEQIEGNKDATDIYLNDPVSNVMTERYEASGVTTWRTYFVVDGKITAERFSSGSTVTMQYFILDHLGSVAAIAAVNPTTGAITTTQQAYDAWGKMRVAATGADDMTCSLPPASLSTRGFTNQEQMADVCLDNYNARIYDPQIGRFMSADTEVPDLHNTQSYNRYTYVENGPLSYTDPTGHALGGNPGPPLEAPLSQMDAIDLAVSTQDFLGDPALGGLFSNSTQTDPGGLGGGKSQAGIPAVQGNTNSVVISKSTQKIVEIVYDKSTDLGQQIAGSLGDGGTFKFNASTGALNLTGGEAGGQTTVNVEGDEVGAPPSDDTKGNPSSKMLTHATDSAIPEGGFQYESDSRSEEENLIKQKGDEKSEWGGGSIYYGGEYYPTDPVTKGLGAHWAAALQFPNGGQVAEIVHSHPDGYASEIFSQNDVDTAKAMMVTSWIMVYQDHSLRWFDPKTMDGQTTMFREGRVIEPIPNTSRGATLCTGCW
jgi:RHS repeat-associated protein